MWSVLLQLYFNVFLSAHEGSDLIFYRHHIGEPYSSRDFVTSTDLGN